MKPWKWMKKRYQVAPVRPKFIKHFYASSVVVSLWEESFAKAFSYWVPESSQSPPGMLNVLLRPPCNLPSGLFWTLLQLHLLTQFVFRFPSCISPLSLLQQLSWRGHRGWRPSLNPPAKGSSFFLKPLDLCSDRGHSVLRGIGGRWLRKWRV